MLTHQLQLRDGIFDERMRGSGKERGEAVSGCGNMPQMWSGLQHPSPAMFGQDAIIQNHMHFE